MLESLKADIVTDASGDATVYLTHGISRKPRGLLLKIKYNPGTIDTGADIEISGESSGEPILTIADAGTSAQFYYPRAMLNEVSNGDEGITGTELIPIVDERIKVVVSNGGDTKTGSVEAVILTDSPY
jgi:hypothetical protein